MRQLVVVGATGDVGRGIICEALTRGWRVTGVARSARGLRLLAEKFSSPRFTPISASLSRQFDREELLVQTRVSEADGVVVAVNAPFRPRTMLEWEVDEFVDMFTSNLLPHFIAASAFIGALPPGALYLAVGGGTADFVLPRNGHMSIVQSAQRMMIRALAREEHGRRLHIKELIIASMVNGASSRERAEATWLTDAEIGRYICDVVANPSGFSGTILTLNREELDERYER